MDETIVKDWLRSLSVAQYSASFIDNGYDDLEICKQIDAPDLDAIGVVDLDDRNRILQAVWTLKVEGAASVYFTIEEAQAASRSSLQDLTSPTTGEGGLPPSLREKSTSNSESKSDIDTYEVGKAELIRFPQTQLRCFIQDELLKDNIDLTVPPYSSKVGERGILEGLASRYADILNTHYQDVLEHLEYIRTLEWSKTGSNSLLNETERELSQREISSSNFHNDSENSQQESSSAMSDPPSDCPLYVPGKYNPSSCLSDAEEDQIYGFTKGAKGTSINASNSLSGCLNPRSECIYELPPSQRQLNSSRKRLGLGKFLKTLKRDLKLSSDSKVRNCTSYPTHASSKQPRMTPDLSSTPLVVLPGYSSPTSSHCSQSSKSHSSGQSCLLVTTSVSAPGTPGSSGAVRESGIQAAIEKLKEDEVHLRRQKQFKEHEQILEDIRHGLLQMENTKSFDELRRRNRHQTFSTSYGNYEGIDVTSSVKDAMNLPDEGKRHSSGIHSGTLLPFHWYDEPPYESDPEEFLINFVTDSEKENSLKRTKDEDVISLKTAGDISLPRDTPFYPSIDSRRSSALRDEPPKNSSLKDRSTSSWNRRREYPQKMNLFTGAPFGNESIDPKNSICEVGPTNHLTVATSSINDGGVETHSEQTTNNSLSFLGINPRLSNLNYHRPEGRTALRPMNQRFCSDYSLSRDFVAVPAAAAAAASSSSNARAEKDKRDDGDSLVSRMKKTLQKDMQKKISCLKNNGSSRPTPSNSHNHPPPLPLSAIPCGGRSGPYYSNHDDWRRLLTTTELLTTTTTTTKGLEDRCRSTFGARQSSLPVKFRQVTPNYEGRSSSREVVNSNSYFIGLAKALVDYQPSACEDEALSFKKGDFLNIISKDYSGLWHCYLNGRIGYVKSPLVEEVELIFPASAAVAEDVGAGPRRSFKRYGVCQDASFNAWNRPCRDALMGALRKFGLEYLCEVFFANGFEGIGDFMMIKPNDLNRLGILDPNQQIRVMEVVNFLRSSTGFKKSPSFQLSPSSQDNSPMMLLNHPSKNIPYLSTTNSFEEFALKADRLYENTSKLSHHLREYTATSGTPSATPQVSLNGGDQSLRSSSSTDISSSGYYSRLGLPATSGPSSGGGARGVVPTTTITTTTTTAVSQRSDDSPHSGGVKEDNPPSPKHLVDQSRKSKPGSYHARIIYTQSPTET